MSSAVRSYSIGFIVSIVLTAVAFLMVEHHALPTMGLIVTIVGLAVIQLAIQLIFFLHIGSGSGARWKIATFFLAFIVICIVVGGSIWIMNNLNYSMLRYTPQEQNQYLHDHEGI
jgi:cytochrome o ubiquinol oxidase operon protein cyoD